MSEIRSVGAKCLWKIDEAKIDLTQNLVVNLSSSLIGALIDSFQARTYPLRELLS